MAPHLEPLPKNSNCRVCGHKLFPGPLLQYTGMPRAAQYLPDEAGLGEDRGVNLEVHQCAGCGLVQLANEPVPYYREVIRAAGVSKEMGVFRRGQFARFVSEHRLQRKKLLEVGCGRGEYLSLIQEQDVEATGLEFSQTSVDTARCQGLNVLQGFLSGDGQALPGVPYDAFLMLAFLEHLPDPCATLRGIHDQLVEDAVGLVEVPNFDMILARDMFSEFIGDHLSYFTRETLEATLSRSGFVLLGCEEVWQGYILSASVKKRPRLDLMRFHACQSQLTAELETFIGGFPPGRVAAWGAGHQALAVLALADLGGKLRYVVDSAPFKQGRYTPSTHLPIVPPNRLDSDPVEGLIIMAASYSDEVARILQKKHPGRFRICILRERSLEILEPQS